MISLIKLGFIDIEGFITEKFNGNNILIENKF